MIKEALVVGLGGLVGSIGRYTIGYLVLRMGSQLPLGTLLVNLMGSLLIGVLVALSFRQSELWKLLLITGFCGGFTTFSAFSIENIKLIQNGLYQQSLLYMIYSVIGGLLLAGLGYWTTLKFINQ